MPEDILFQRDRLTVAKSHLKVGRVTAFYPNISALSIYDGRPLLASAIVACIGLIPLIFLFISGSRILGQLFPSTVIAIMMLPALAMIVVGFTYRVKCLFVTIDGQAIAVLKSKDMAVLQHAKARIEGAKAAQDGRNPTHI